MPIISPTAISPFNRGGTDWSSYWKKQSLFFLDGTIVTVGSDKYFKDASTNGRNFLITGYDFATDWTTGFPYKSAATISAPAADAALIAADINNFLYDSGGTPNAIPVVSLFQDIDYEHKIFCKHNPQLVVTVAVETETPGVYEDIDIETYEPRVSAIFMATDALSGDDLTKAQTDFGVPDEITTNVKWISPAGNDTTGNGSKALPWKTFVKADAAATVGDTVYAKTGVYDENSPLVAGTLYLTKSLTYSGLGGVRITSTGASYVIYHAGTANITYKRCIIDAENEKNFCVNIYGVGNKTITWQDCLFTRPNTSFYDGKEIETTTYENCVFKGDAARATQNVSMGYALVDTCYFKNASVIANFNAEIANTRIPETKFIAVSIGGDELNLYGCDITHKTYGVTTVNDAVEGKLVKVRYSNFTIDSGGANVYSVNTLVAKVTTIVDRCIFRANAVGNFIVTQGDALIINNNLYDNISNFGFHIYGDNGVVKIKNNYSHTNSLSGTQITIGNETSVSDRNNGSEFKNNTVIGAYKENPTATMTTQHGVLITSGINIDISNNFISYGRIGLVVKTNAQAYTSKGVVYNLFKNCGISIYVRGITGINILNNTISHNNDEATFLVGILANENSAAAGDQFAENVIMKNNIIHVTAATGNLIQLDAHAGSNGCVVEHSILRGGQYVLVHEGTGSYASIALAQAAGWCADCVSTDPSLSDDLIPASAITGAEDLGTDYDDGLDVTTTWGSSSTVPAIVTKQQPATWQMGAYVQ